MLAYFPTVHDDELIYSVLCRLYAHTGYSAYSYFASNVFSNPHQRVNIEFINELTEDAWMKLIESISVSKLINFHTMAPAYLHFEASPHKQDAYKFLINNNVLYKTKITFNASGELRYLKYCPKCASEDRRKYGEAIWHRSHQIEHINICHIHAIKLINSTISMSGKVSPTLHPAEIEVPIASEEKEEKNELTIDFVKYLISVFNTPISVDNQMKMGTFLHTQLFGTKYVSTRGEQRNISLLCNELKAFYSDTCFINYITNDRVQKLFTSHRHNFLEICLLAYFLKISPIQLCNRIPTSVNQIEAFDNQVLELFRNGVGTNQISRIMGVSSRTVCLILKPAEAKERNIKYTCGPVKKNWNKIDEQTLPLVKDSIKKILSSYRPKRVTVFAITKELHLPDKTLYHLSSCLAEILKYRESQEEYWTREMIWAYQDILANSDTLQWTSIRKRTNLRRSNALKCIPTLQANSSADALEIIKILVGDNA